MFVGTKIRALRESKNISREQMADWLSMSLNTYKKIEYNERNPTFNEIEKIGDFLEIDPAVFFENSGGTFIQTGSNNGMVGNGKVIMADKKFMLEVMSTLKEISNVLSKVCNRLDERNK